MSSLVKFFTVIISYLIPVNKQLFLFGSWFGNRYGDNARYFYEWLIAEQNDIEAIWVTKNPTLHTDMVEKGLPVVKEGTLKSWWLHIRAGAVFCNTSHESDLYGIGLNHKVKVFNLWHGTPMKKIGLDALESNISTEKLGVKHKTFLSSLFSRKLYEKVKSFVYKDTYFLASSNLVATLLQSAMGVKKEKIIVDGYPKLDHLIKANKLLSCGQILYAPTYRGEYDSENDLLSEFDFDKEAINAWLTKVDKYLTIRLHPANKLPDHLIHALNELSRINVGGSGDLYESLVNFELVITDFSSLYYDCLAIKVPVVLAPFGLASYIENDRPLYFAPEELYPETLAQDWPSLIALLPSVYESPVELSGVRSKFYVESSGESSSSLFNKVSQIINAK